MKLETLDALAALELARKGGRRSPRSLRLDADGASVSMTVPAAAVLAEVPGLLPGPDAGLCRIGDAGLASSSGEALSWGLRDLALRLVERLAALPDREDAGVAYRDLRMLCRAFPETHGVAYVLEAVRSWRRGLPPLAVERVPGRSGTERVRDHRHRLRGEEEESSRFFFRHWLRTGDDGGPVPAGTRVLARALHEEAVSVLGEEADLGNTVDEDDEVEARVPRPRLFYRIGDEVFGHKRRKTREGASYWTVSEEVTVSS